MTDIKDVAGVVSRARSTGSGAIKGVGKLSGRVAPRLSDEEKAIAEEIIALREKARALRDPILRDELRALQRKAIAMREQARASFAERLALPKPAPKPRGRPRLSDEERAKRNERSKAWFKERRARERKQLAELLKAANELTHRLETELLEMENAT
jgi:hypothetical protein